MSSGRDVVDALLRGGSAERVALMGSPWGDTLARWSQEGYPMREVHRAVGENVWCDDGKRREAEREGDYPEPVAPWEVFGYDMVGTGGWFDWQPIRGQSILVEETDEWAVRRNGSGAALKYWKHKSGTPEHIDFLMSSREIWERDYRPHLLTYDPDRVDIEGARKAREAAKAAGRWTHYGHQFIWENMRASMGDITMYQSLVLDPEWIHDYCRVYTDLYKHYFGMLFEQAGKPDGVWLYEDLGYKNGLFASPKVLSQVVFPYFAELVAFIHEYDLPVVLHTCGSTAEALPMIVEAGFDGLNPMERKALNNEPFDFAERYGDKLTFVGGLDARVLESNDVETIEREVAYYIDGMKARGARLVFAEDHSISPNVSYASYLRALDVYREHMMY